MKRNTKGPSKGSLTVTWLGHSAFKFESPGGKTILIDPWLNNPKAPDGAMDISKIDLILVTHGHGDHIGNTVDLAKRTNARVLAIHEVSLYLLGAGVTSAEGMNISGTASVGNINVTMVEAKHSSGIESDGEVIAGGEPAGYVIRFENGFTVYHAGDTGLFSDMKLIAGMYKPDAVFLPIGGYYTMGPREAAKAAEFLNPKHIIGMHYGTFPVLSGTPEELKKHLPVKLRSRVHTLEPGKPIML